MMRDVAGSMAATASAVPQVAVIVPVYNPGDYLHQCVESILGQTFRDWEMVLVDDGSTDGSGAVCDQYAAADSRVRVVHKENGGLMSAWMRGVAESTAPYLFFVDSDDWVDLNSLEILVDHIISDNLKQIICAGCLIEKEWNHSQTPEGNSITPGTYIGDDLQQQIKNQLLGNEYRRILPSRCMKLIDRRLIEENLHYCDPSIRMGEDLNIMAPALLDADRIVVLERSFLYHYRYVSASMVHRYDAGLYDNVRRLIAILRQVLNDKGIPDADAMADREFVYLFLLTLKNEIRRGGVPAAEVVTRIRELCRTEDSQALLQRIGGRGTLQDRANRLLSLLMERPSALRIRIVRRIFLMRG